MFYNTSRRLLHPPDVGAEAKEVVDPDLEQKTAVGMVIRSNQFPDKLFAPPKRTDLMHDKLNPVYDKEMRSELFGQGTLMLRLVIQLSMFLALPLMAVCCFIRPVWIPWYACYVLLFNVLVGPVFAAGSITSERERQTLELLLTTTLSPWEILWGKMLSSLRVSLVLTAFVAWPLLLAWLLPPWTYWDDTLSMLGYVAVVAMSCLTTTILAMFCSVLVRKTTTAMMTAYIVIMLVICGAFGRGRIRAIEISRGRLHSLDRQTHLYQSLCRRVQSAAESRADCSAGQAPPKRPSPPIGRFFSDTLHFMEY